MDPALVSRHQTTGSSSPETNIPADLRTVPHSINFQIFCQGALWPRIVLVDVSIFTRPGTKFLANIRVITLPWLLPWLLPWRRWCPILGSAVRTRLKSPLGNFSPSLFYSLFPGSEEFYRRARDDRHHLASCIFVWQILNIMQGWELGTPDPVLLLF